MEDVKANKKLSNLLSDLKRDYLKDFPRKLEKLKKFTDEEDWENLYEEYHKLKGTGKTYGLPEISVVCERLEYLASKKESQKQALFQDALKFLGEMHLAYLKNEQIDIYNHSFGKTILRSGRKK